MRFVHNFVILTDPTKTLEEVLVEAMLLFPSEEEFQLLPNESTMFDILVNAGIFTSKSDARRNWKTTGQDIPLGWTWLRRIGKFKNEVAIWKPDWNLTAEQRILSATSTMPKLAESTLDNFDKATGNEKIDEIGGFLVGKVFHKIQRNESRLTNV